MARARTRMARRSGDGCCDDIPRSSACRGRLDDLRESSGATRRYGLGSLGGDGQPPPNSLISRAGYSGYLGDGPTVPPPTTKPGLFASVGGAVRNLFSLFGNPTPQAPVVVQDDGIDTTTVLIGGVAVAGIAYLLLRKKKA